MSQLDATHHLSVVQSDAHPDDRELKGKRAATRHRLMNACETIIVDSGFRAVSMTAIAEQAGITRQTVYRYFANSREAIEATLLRAGREVLEAQCLVLRERGEPRDLIVTAVITSLRLINHNMLLVKALNSDGNPKALFSATLSSDLAVRSAEELKRIGDRVRKFLFDDAAPRAGRSGDSRHTLQTTDPGAGSLARIRAVLRTLT